LVYSSQKWTAFHGYGAYPPDGTWSWSFNENGVAGENSDYGSGNGLAPDGDFVAFLESTAGHTSYFSFELPLPDANPVGKAYRISFFAAQRKHVGTEVVDQQVVQVSVTMPGTPLTNVVFAEQIRDKLYRKYVTRPFVATAATIVVEFAGTKQDTVAHVALLDKVEVREALPWGAAATWNGQPIPTSGDAVLVPENACVGIESGVAWSVTVEGELLALDTAQGGLTTRFLDVHLASASVGIAPQGTSLFQVGTEGAPYVGTFELLLNDDRTDSNRTNPDPDPKLYNALHVSDDGMVEMHGQKRTSWLRLAQDAGPNTPLGPLTIMLERVPDGWGPGDNIIIASSDRDFEHAEPATIASIVAVPNPPGQPLASVTLEVQAPLDFYHCGQVLQFAPPLASQPSVLDQRAEVGLLSHNVKITAPPRTPSPTSLGGHIMIEASRSDLTHGGFGRFSGVELFNLGRAGQTARYPIHWHMLLGAGKDQYMKGSSIRYSNNRAAVVHGTDYVLFEDNVAWEHYGHGVFLEDGSEQFNVFRKNLILSTRPPSLANRILPSDTEPRLPGGFQNRAPAAFWITNPNNVFEDNVVGGADGTGYWFALPKRWMGMSFDLQPARFYFESRTPAGLQRAPRHQVLGSFARNACHSAYLAFDVHDGIQVASTPEIVVGTVLTNVTWQPYTGQLQVLDAFQAYSCNVGIYTGGGDQNLRFEQAALADNSWQIVFASHDILSNSVVMHDSGHNLWPAPPYFLDRPHRSIAFVLYDGAAKFENVHCRGFDNPRTHPTEPSTVLWGVGAAKKRTSWQMSGLTFATRLNPTVHHSPILDLDDVSSPPPPGTNFSGLSPWDPSYWAFSIDNPDRTLFSGLTTSTAPLTTVVANHPLMTGTGLEVSLNATSTAWASPFRFDYMRVFATDANGTPVPAQSMLDLSMERLSTVLPGPTVAYANLWRALDHKQMAVIVDRQGENNGFRYLLDWFDSADPTTPAPIPVHTQVWLAEMEVGDTAVVGLKRYPATHANGNLLSVSRVTAIIPTGSGLPPAVVLTPETSMGNFNTATATT
jgi:hypothetical protein